jgi:hypothetical protein
MKTLMVATTRGGKHIRFETEGDGSLTVVTYGDGLRAQQSCLLEEDVVQLILTLSTEFPKAFETARKFNNR